MSYATIEDLRSQLGDVTPSRTPEYVAKMMHAVPEFSVVQRILFLLEQATGKIVLNLGCEGVLHQELKRVASTVYGADKRTDVGADIVVDFDDHHDVLMCEWPLTDIIVCGEVLEHLSNPGRFLQSLRGAGASLVVTVPNAFTDIGRSHLKRGIENVNKDHVTWFSYTTLGNLLRRAGWAPYEWHWYNGVPMFAEGLIAVAR